MTAHLGKALREASRAEPAHEGGEYAHLTYNIFFGSKNGAGCVPRVVFGSPAAGGLTPTLGY